MKIQLICILMLLTAGIFISGCSYKKGDAYFYNEQGDTLKFIVRSKGSGKAILKKVDRLREVHQNRKDEYKFVFLSDSLEVIGNKAVLLSHSEMPDYEEDMLTKGYLGAFGTKEVVIYMIVTAPDLERHFFPE